MEEGAANHHLSAVNTTYVGSVFVALSHTGLQSLVLVVQVLLTVATVASNTLVILATGRDKRFQSSFYYYVTNLAVTDLLIGLVAMPTLTAFQWYGDWPMSSATCTAWIWLDYTLTLESMLSVVTIALDRLWVVSWTVHYHNTVRRSTCQYVIAATWVTTTAVWMPGFLHDRLRWRYRPGVCTWDLAKNRYFAVYLVICGYYVPLVILLVSYIKVYLVIRKKSKAVDPGRTSQRLEVAVITIEPPTGEELQLHSSVSEYNYIPPPNRGVLYTNQRSKRETRAVRTVGKIVIVFLVCWGPSCVLLTVGPWWRYLVPPQFSAFSWWMSYLQSFLNPFLYSFSSQDFREAAWKMVRGQESK